MTLPDGHENSLRMIDNFALQPEQGTSKLPRLNADSSVKR
jgi:hypothetical protein